jgi:hypothetical protein
LLRAGARLLSGLPAGFGRDGGTSLVTHQELLEGSGNRVRAPIRCGRRGSVLVLVARSAGCKREHEQSRASRRVTPGRCREVPKTLLAEG